MKKKIIVTSLAASLAVTPFVNVGLSTASANGVVAATLTQQEQQLIQRIQALHTALNEDVNDFNAVDAAADRFRAYQDFDVEQKLAIALANTQLGSSQEQAKQAAIVDFILSLTTVYYSNNLDNTLLSIKDSAKTLSTQLGVTLTSADALAFAKKFEETLAGNIQIFQVLELLGDDNANDKQQLAGYMSTKARETLNQLVGGQTTDYPAIRTALIAGLGEANFIDEFVTIKKNLEAHIDEEARAQTALAKAYVRSETKVYNAAGTGVLTELNVQQNNTVQFQLKVKAASQEFNVFSYLPLATNNGLTVEVYNASDVLVSKFTPTRANGVVSLQAASDATVASNYKLKVFFKHDGKSALIKSIPLSVTGLVSGGGGGGGTTTTPSTPATTPSDLSNLTAEQSKQVLETLVDNLRTADQTSRADLANQALVVARDFVQKAALEQLQATVTGGNAEARVTAEQLRSVVAKALNALAEARALLESAGVQNASLNSVLTFEVTNGADNNTISLGLTELAAALSGSNLSSVGINFKVNGVSVVLSVSDILDSLTAKASVAAAAEEDDFKMEILKTDLTDAPGANLKALNGVKVVEVKAVSKQQEVTSFKQAAKVEIEVGSLPSGTNAQKVAAYQLVDGKWIPVGGHYADGKVSFKTKKPGKFTVFASTKSFSDLGSVAWAQTQIESMAAKGIVTGRSEVKFAPNDKVTRAEFATLLVRAFGLYEEDVTSGFSDVKSSDWFHAGVASAAKYGIVSGVSGNKFNPNAPVTRAEMATMAANALKKLNGETVADAAKALEVFADQADIPSWAKDGVAQVVEQDIIKGMSNNTFAPKQNATRAQAAVVIYGLYNNQQ